MWLPTPRRSSPLLVLLGLLATLAPAEVASQELRGRVIDAESGAPVPLAAVFILSRSQDVVRQVIADSLGRFSIEAPGPGDYYLVAQSLGYVQTLSALLALGDRSYDLDLELTPDPIRLDPLQITVRNQEMIDWFRLNTGGNPNAAFGFRAIQGADLYAAQQKARDNTDMLRWLYIPVSHGRVPCVGYALPPLSRGALPLGEPACGELFVGGEPLPVEHIETLDRWSIAVVAVIPPNVFLFTRGFRWRNRPGR